MVAKNLTTSVIIPSFRRHTKLKKCICGINNQTILPSELIIVFSKHDRETEKVINETAKNVSFQIKKIAIESMDSLAIALNKGLKLANKEIVIFTDDDVIPKEDWICRIVNAYKLNSSIGGVGGRDQVYRNGKLVQSKKVKTVGKLTRLGRIIGNHHELVDNAREVDFLKGCNMSFRRELIGDIDEKLIGIYRTEQDLCFQVKTKGYKLWHSPEILINHMKGEEEFSLGRFFAFSHNTTYILLKYLGRQRKVIFLLYTFLVGQRENLGFLRSALLPISLRNFDLLITCLLGKIRGITTFFKNRQVL